MLTELCQELRNWFEKERHEGTFTINGGTLTADFLQEGQYYRIIGSVFNDGVHVFHMDDDYELRDETFSGMIVSMAVPKEVVELARKIEAWSEKYENVDSEAMSPYTSESFGGYSYNKGTSAMSVSGKDIATGWKAVFASQLNRWRKI